MRILFILLICISNIAIAADKVTANGLFIGKAIIKINGNPIMFFEGDKKHGLKLISANEDRAIVEIKGKRQTLYLDTSIANEYSKPVAEKKFGLAANTIHSIELMYQSSNVATLMVEYTFDDNASDYKLIAEVMVDKKAVDYVSYNYVPLKAGKHKTHITIAIAESAPEEFESDHILVNFANAASNKAFDIDSALISPLKKKWQH